MINDLISAEEIRTHMQDHPSELLFVCKRQSLTSDINQSDIESTQIVPLPRRRDVTYLKFDSDLDRLRNFSNVESICD